MNRKPSSTEDRRADGSLWYRESRLCEWRRLMRCSRWAEEQWCSNGVKEVQDADAGRHTLPGVDFRFSWFLSRRLRKRETPELFMTVECIHKEGAAVDAVMVMATGEWGVCWARQVQASSCTVHVPMTVWRVTGAAE